METTFGMIKPHAFGKRARIIEAISSKGFKVEKSSEITVTEAEAKELYSPHADKSFYDELIDGVSGKKVVVMRISGGNAILGYRELMGATNPKDAKPDTLRADFGEDISKNAVHGSDSSENAVRELAIFKKYL